jgi:hypothetical protein
MCRGKSGQCLELSSEFAEFKDNDLRVRGKLRYERTMGESKYPMITNS